MSDPVKQAWSEVGDGFATLGRMMKERYQTGDDADTETTAGEERDAGTAFREAVDRLVAAGRELGERASDVVRDDDVKAQAKRAAATLNDALSATVDLIGDQVGGLFGRSKEGSSEASSVDTTSTGDLPPAEVPRTAPPADDVRQ